MQVAVNAMIFLFHFVERPLDVIETGMDLFFLICWRRLVVSNEKGTDLFFGHGWAIVCNASIRLIQASKRVHCCRMIGRPISIAASEPCNGLS